MDKVRISIVIPTHNRKDYLFTLLNQLFNQTITETELNYIVVVDGSKDGTKEMLNQHFPNVNIIEGNGNWWYTRCVNEGFKYADKFNPDYILTINDDVKIENNFIENIINATKIADENSIIGVSNITLSKPHKPLFLGVKQVIWHKYKFVNYTNLFNNIKYEDIFGLYESKVAHGRAMFIPYKILKELNYFDKLLPQYGSDNDFSFRAIKKGYKVYVSWDAKVFSYENKKSSLFAPQDLTYIGFIKALFNKYSKIYIYKTILITYRNTNIFLFPFVLFIPLMRIVKYFFQNRLEKR